MDRETNRCVHWIKATRGSKKKKFLMYIFIISFFLSTTKIHQQVTLVDAKSTVTCVFSSGNNNNTLYLYIKNPKYKLC